MGRKAELSFWEQGSFLVLAVLGLFLIGIHGGISLPWWGEVIKLQITLFFVFFGILYVRRLHKKIPILKDTPRYMIMFGLLVLLCISFIQQIRHVPPIIKNKKIPLPSGS